jgi:hypothetical protein
VIKPIAVLVEIDYTFVMRSSDSQLREAIAPTCATAADSDGRFRFQFRTRHLFWLTTGVCILLGVPGLLWISLHFLAGAALIGVGAVVILVAIVMEFVVVLMIPPLRRQLFGPREPLSLDVLLGRDENSTPANDA